MCKLFVCILITINTVLGAQSWTDRQVNDRCDVMGDGNLREYELFRAPNYIDSFYVVSDWVNTLTAKGYTVHLLDFTANNTSLSPRVKEMMTRNRCNVSISYDHHTLSSGRPIATAIVNVYVESLDYYSYYYFMFFRQ